MGDSTSDIKVSVTVPVYNTSKYLRQCLDSLEAQTLQEIEFILVDDGSTDDSGDICDEYARRNPKFKVIHQPNTGLAMARQTGMDHVKGEYVIVCDSDDWVDPEMYETLYKTAVDTNADITICGYWREYSCKRHAVIPEVSDQINQDDNKYLLFNNTGSSWNKLIKRSFFIASEVKYESGIDMGEDVLINYKLFKFNPTFACIPIALYHYRRRIGENSYTNVIKPEYVYQRYYVYQWMKNNYIGDIYLPYVLKDAIFTAIICTLSEKPDKVFFAQFVKENLSWKMLFRFIKIPVCRRMALIKLFPTSIKIGLIRIYFSIKEYRKTC